MKEGDPYVFAARKEPDVRAYSMGPGHRDWLCLKCGAVSKACWDVIDGKLAGWRYVRREMFEHLQGHVRFDLIERQ